LRLSTVIKRIYDNDDDDDDDDDNDDDESIVQNVQYFMKSLIRPNKALFNYKGTVYIVLPLRVTALPVYYGVFAYITDLFQCNACANVTCQINANLRTHLAPTYHEISKQYRRFVYL